MVPPPKDPMMPIPATLPAPAIGWQPIPLVTVRALVWKLEDGSFVGHCLEHQISVQGATIQDIAKEVSYVLAVQCLCDQSANRVMLSTLKQSSEEYWKAWADAEQVNVAKTNVHIALHDAAAFEINALFKVDCGIIQRQAA